MPNAANAELYYEAGQRLKPLGMMSSLSPVLLIIDGAEVWSRMEGFEPEIRPNGLATGGKVTPTGVNNEISVAALTAYINGKLVSLPSTILTVTRALLGQHKIYSITMNDVGDLAVVGGADNSEATAFSETRGTDAAPPWIATGSIEIAQVRLSAQANNPVLAAEILSIPNTHTEYYDYPTWDVNALGNNENGAHILLNVKPALIHSYDGGTTVMGKRVFAQVFEPDFALIGLASDFKTAEESISSSSTPVYNGKTVASSSTSLGQGGFTAFGNNGITDPLIKLRGKYVAFKFKPNRYKSEHHLVTGSTWNRSPMAGRGQYQCVLHNHC